MTEREQVARYLTKRTRRALADGEMNTALHLSDFLVVVMDMDDEEFEQEEVEAQVA